MSPAQPPGIYALIGKPVAGNPTQEMLEAAFAAAGIDARYISLTVEPTELEDAVRAVRALGFRGLHITAPHKVSVVPLVDRLTPAAELAGAVNCIRREDAELVGDNTDGRGFLESLRATRDPSGARAVVFGAGGAARAIVAELALADAGHITVVARSRAAAEEVTGAIAGRTRSRCDAAGLTEDWPVPGEADVVVQATTVGMGDPDARLPLRWRPSPNRAVAADVVIAPPQTAFLRDAAAAGCTTIDGLGMLVEQAVIGFRWWTGREPDARVMREVLERELALAAGRIDSRGGD